MAPVEFRAWTLFTLSVATGRWDPCFFRNTYIASLFMEVHLKRLGPNPKPVQPTPVRELALADYSWEALRAASDNFREPVVVRGLFADSAAVKTWGESGLAVLDSFNVTVVPNSTIGKDHFINCGEHKAAHSIDQLFSEAMHEIKQYDPNGANVSKTMILPPASRSVRTRNPAFDSAMTRLVDDDLDLTRIGGPWYKGQKNAALTQFFIGAGDVEGTQGTGWHGDICNNQIVQVFGSKQWLWIHPRHSPLLRPTMMPGKSAISFPDFSIRTEVVPFLPRMEAKLNPGDFLYNPDWYWHRVVNDPGISMAVVSRECNVTNLIRGNPIMSSLVITNHVKAALFGGDTYAFARLMAALTGSSIQTGQGQAK